MTLFRTRGSLLVLGLLAMVLTMSGCSRLFPMRKGEAQSAELVLDTRRAPAEALSGCFVPAVFPAITKLPVVFSNVPPGATFISVKHEVILKNDDGQMSLLEPMIENNQVYLKFAVPTVTTYASYHVIVRAVYQYR